MYKNHYDYSRLSQTQMPSELGIDFPKERTQPKRGWTAELNQESMPQELGIPADI